MMKLVASVRMLVLVRTLVLVRMLAVVLPPQTLAGEEMMVGVGVAKLHEWWQEK